jgi:hypothetical protein
MQNNTQQNKLTPYKMTLSEQNETQQAERRSISRMTVKKQNDTQKAE